MTAPRSAHGPAPRAAGHPGGRPAAQQGPLPAAVRNVSPRWALWASAGLAWGSASATAVLFVLVGRAVDELLDGRRPEALPLMTALVLLAAVLAGLGAWFSQRASAEAERRLRGTVVARVFERGATDVAGRSGALLALATGAVERVAQYRAAFIGPMLGALTSPLLALGVLALAVDPVAASLLALLLLVVPPAIGGFQRLVRPLGGASRRTQARLTAGFLESIQALGTLAYARAAGRAGDELARRGETYRRDLLRVLAGNQLLILVVDAVFSLSVIVAAAVIATARVASGALSLGEAAAVLLIALLVTGPVDMIGQFFYVGIGGRAAQGQIAGHLAGPRSRATARMERADAPAGSIVLDAVTAGWPGAEPVLRGLSLRVEPGERVALVGPSGVGKSTVAALIQGHLHPLEGHVIVDGLSGDPAGMRARLAVVEQQTFLFLGTIAENLRVAAPDATDAELWQALDDAGLREEIEALPEGLGAEVGEQGALLSGGQAQRLAIARAFLRDAPILLLDEPTSQVDLASETAILAALDRLAAGRTVLMIAHRPGAILAADRVIALGSGS
jgi:ABC-type multidrug transport system fused ATPase/permease subunit